MPPQPAPDLQTDQPPWPTLVPRPAVPWPHTTEVLVVGAGLAGLALATALARQGVRVVLAEARPDVGRGTGGRDPGVLTGGLPEHPWRLVEAVGVARTALLYGLTDRGIAGASGLVTHNGPVLHAAIDEREVTEIDRSAEALRSLGKQVTRLGASETCDALGGSEFTAGMRIEGEVALDTHRVALRLADELHKHDGHLLTNTRVTRLTRSADGHHAHTPHGTVLADAVVLCTDHTARELLPWLNDKIVPVREHALRLQVARSIPAGKAQYGYVSWRTDDQGGLRISGCRWATPHLEVFETQERPRTLVLDKIRAFAQRHLGVGEAPTTHRWARILTATCDGLPILGPVPGDPTTVLCTGFQGFGPAFALACAEDVCTGLMTGRSPLPDWLSPQRFL